MDPISILGTAIGVATVAAEVSKSLFKAGCAISKSHEEANELTDQLSTLTSTLTTMKTIVEEKKELYNPALSREVHRITGRVKEITGEVERMMRRSKANKLRLALKLHRVKPLLRSIKAMESSLQTILIGMLVAREEVKPPHERSKPLPQQKYANSLRLLAESRVENNRQVIQHHLALEAAEYTHKRYGDTRAVNHHLQGQEDTATWLYRLVFEENPPEAPIPPNNRPDPLETPTVRTVNTAEAVQAAESYQTATLIREAERVVGAPMDAIPERKGSTTTQPSTSRRSTVSNGSFHEQNSERVSVDGDEEMDEGWESDENDAESDEGAAMALGVYNRNGSRQRLLPGPWITSPAARAVDNILRKFTTLSDDQIHATSQPVSLVLNTDATPEPGEERNHIPEERIGDAPSLPQPPRPPPPPPSIPESIASSDFAVLQNGRDTRREREPPRRPRHRLSRSPIRDRFQAGHNTASHDYPDDPRQQRRYQRNGPPSTKPMPTQNRNHAHGFVPFSGPSSHAPENNPFDPFYQYPNIGISNGPSYTSPPNFGPHGNLPFQPYGAPFHRAPSPLRRRYRSLSPRFSAPPSSPPPAPAPVKPPPRTVNESSAEEKLRDLEHKERNERLAKLEDFIRETREEKLQEEAKAAASAAKEEAIERKNRDNQIRASLAELTSRQKGEEVKRDQEQLLAALDARREEAEAKAAAEREKYLKLEVQRNEDADRRVAEALAETRAVFAKEMAELKNAAQKAAASARAAMKSKKLAEAESAKRARDAAQKTAEEEKRRLIDEYKLLLEEYQTRLLDVEQAEAAAEARHQETKAAPTRQLRMEDGDRRMELIETQHGMSEPLANTDFLASTFFQNRKPSPFFSRAGRSPARPRTQRTTSDVRSLSSEESEEDRRDALSGKTVVLLPSAENTSESEMLEIRTALQESGFSASNSLVPFKGHKARRSKGIPATFQWDSPLSAESQLLLTMKEHGWKPIYRRITDLGQTWFIGHNPVQIDFFTPQYRPQIGPVRTRRKDPGGNLIIGSDWIDEDVIKSAGKKFEISEGFFLLGLEVSAQEIDTLVSLTMQRREINLHKRYNLTIEAPSDHETESSVEDSEMYQSKEQGAFEDPGYQDQGWTEGWNTDEREQVSEPWNQLSRSKHNTSRTSNRSVHSTRTNGSAPFQSPTTPNNLAVVSSSLKRSAGMPGLRPQRQYGGKLVTDGFSPGVFEGIEPLSIIPKTRNGPGSIELVSPMDRPKSRDSAISVSFGKSSALQPHSCHRRSKSGTGDGNFQKEHKD